MNSPRPSTLTHGESFRLLPWYVKGRLDPEQLRQVDLHLQGCLACRREADGLTQLFCAHTQLSKPRQVDDARLDALFARIDRYEASRRREPPRAGKTRSALARLRDAIAEWLETRFVLVAGACAATVLAVVLAPTMFAPTVETQHQVLSSPVAAPNELRVSLQFRSATLHAEAERVVSSALTERRLQYAYRVEQRLSTEYVVVFEQTPDFMILSELFRAWRAVPNVAHVDIDSASSQ